MHKPRILVVDDDKQICALLEKRFSSWEMTAESIKNPLYVADKVQRKFYNIILLDIFMSKVKGRDLLASMGNLCPDTKVIIMTGYTDKEMAIEALSMGAFDFLEKPIAMDLLNHAVRRALSVQCIELKHKRTLEELRHRNLDVSSL